MNRELLRVLPINDLVKLVEAYAANTFVDKLCQYARLHKSTISIIYRHVLLEIYLPKGAMRKRNKISPWKVGVVKCAVTHCCDFLHPSSDQDECAFCGWRRSPFTVQLDDLAIHGVLDDWTRETCAHMISEFAS